MRYTPEVLASELGFPCVPARAYDPASGRWLSSEPAGAEDGSGPEADAVPRPPG
jgi:hypothetical protein